MCIRDSLRTADVTVACVCVCVQNPENLMMMIMLMPVSYTHLDVYKRQDVRFIYGVTSIGAAGQILCARIVNLLEMLNEERVRTLDKAIYKSMKRKLESKED